MPQKKLLIANTLSNICYYGVQSAVVFITFPIIVRYFGKDLYGIYAFILGILSISQILNISLNMTLTKYVSEFHALHDVVRLQQLVKNAYFIALVASCFVAVVLTVCSFVSPEIMHLDKRQWPHFVYTVRLLAFFSLINGLAQVPRGILLGLQRYALANLTTLPVILGPAVGVVLMQLLTISLTEYVFLLQLMILTSGVWSYLVVKNILPEIRHGISATAHGLKNFVSFNIYQVLNQIAEVLFYTTDKLILQHVSGPVTVANYAVAERPNQLALSFTSLPLSAIVPACSKAYAEQNLDLIDKMVITGTRFYLLMILPALCTLTFLMPRFLDVWMGSEYVDLALYAQLFMITMIAASPFKVFSHVQMGKGRVREIVSIKAAYAVINVVASYLLARRLGILGVIIPTVVFWAGVYPVVWLYLLRSEGISLVRFVARVGVPAMVTIVSCWGAVALLDGYFDRTVVSLLLIGTLTLGCAYLALFVACVDTDERRVLRDIVEDFTGRFVRGM